jgi:peptide/nickel transport system substrate-binding protein
VIPKEAVSYFGADFRKHPVGTGPFRFGMWKEGVKLVLLKNPHYFESSKGQPLPFLDAVSVTFIKDKQSAFLEFIKGNLDFISGIDAGYKDELLTKKGELNPKYAGRITLAKSPYLNTEYLGIIFDTNNPVMRDNPLKSKLIRQAISFGFDRKQMMQYLRNNIGVPGLHGMVPGGLPWFEQEEITGYGYDPSRSRELLARAGHPVGKGLPPITLSINPSYLDLCKFIQSQLNEIGFNVKIDVSPPATLREMIAQSKIPFFRGSWIADYPDAENYLSLFYSENHCPEGPNYTHYSNREFDNYYRLALTERNDSIRGRIYMKMDQLIMKDAPVVVLFYDQVLRFSRSNVSGMNCNPLNLLHLKNVKKHSL